MSTNISIAVVGQGFVGGSLTTVFSERGITPYVYDITGKAAKGGVLPNHTRGLTRPASNIAEFVQACESIKGFYGVYFVCLPTPMYEDGEADLSIVDGVLSELAKSICVGSVAVIKSTVPPGSTEAWNRRFRGPDTCLSVVFSPEFLREASALEDMRNQSRIILGGPRPEINRVKQIFKQAFPDVPIIKTSSTNAELTKYFTNCFLATKVSFANEMYQLCAALDKRGLDVDYDRVVECASMDERLGKSHWQVPSFETGENGEPLYGFSLSCFPKDLNALICKEKQVGVEPTMLEATWKKNLEVRPQQDWCKMVGRAVSTKTNK